MTRNIFGWDLPPGCTHADIERAAGGGPFELPLNMPGYAAYWDEDGNVYAGVDNGEPPKIGNVDWDDSKTEEENLAEAAAFARSYLTP